MDKKVAAILIASMLERVERDRTLGTVSSLEQTALRLAVHALQGLPLKDPTDPTGLPQPRPITPQPTPPLPDPRPPTPGPHPAPFPPVPPLPPPVRLDDAALKRKTVSNSKVLLCLDFGTAMSKAFATVQPNEYLDLDLGRQVGRKGYTLPSCVFISDDGKAYFGFEAIEQSDGLVDSGRERLDSIKGWLSLRKEGNLDSEACVLTPAMNPTEYRLTQGDLIRLYLAYFTDVAERALNWHGVRSERHVRRRFARPCWPDPLQEKWAEALMRQLLAEAQVLADTFTNRWEGGLAVRELKSALDQLKKLPQRPDYLIAESVPEPVAVAAGAMTYSDNFRDAFMVVDAGAGTTDFGLFITTQKDEESRVFQIPDSIHGLMQAGDKVDGLLRGFIMQREAIDPSDNSGRMILADLTRRIRPLKETLFKLGKLKYTLADGTSGDLTLEEFLAHENVRRFSQAIENGFRKSLEAVNDTWLRWLSMPGVRLHVIVTGGSSALPMMQALAQGVIEVRGFRILRKLADARPVWLDDLPRELGTVYPQLAVAMGGVEPYLPPTHIAPRALGSLR